MADALTDEEKLQRARRADTLLKSDLFQEAVSAVESDCHEAFATSRPGDTEAREAAYQRIAGIRAVSDKLRSWVNDGKVIEARDKGRA